MKPITGIGKGLRATDALLVVAYLARDGALRSDAHVDAGSTVSCTSAQRPSNLGHREDRREKVPLARKKQILESGGGAASDLGEYALFVFRASSLISDSVRFSGMRGEFGPACRARCPYLGSTIGLPGAVHTAGEASQPAALSTARCTPRGRRTWLFWRCRGAARALLPRRARDMLRCRTRI